MRSYSFGSNFHQTLIDSPPDFTDCLACAFCLDIGILSNGNIELVEINDAYSFGHYGLIPELYAQMLEERWIELVK